MQKSIPRVLVAVALLVVIQTTFAGFSMSASRAPLAEPTTGGEQLETERSRMEVDLFVTSPASQGALRGTNCRMADSLHDFPTCDLDLVTPDGRRAWSVPNIMYVAWSSNGKRAVLEDRDHRIWVGGPEEAPIALRNLYSVPAISPSGRRLAAQVLGPGEDFFEQLENSPGIVLLDAHGGVQRMIGPPGAFGAFFLDEQTLGFGWGGAEGIASIYLTDLRSDFRRKLTNLRQNQRIPDPFPIAPPIAGENGNMLFFPAITGGQETIYGLDLYSLQLVERPDGVVDSIRNHQPVVVQKREE